MQKTLDFMEHMEIYNLVKTRESSKIISLEKSAKRHGVSLDEL